MVPAGWPAVGLQVATGHTRTCVNESESVSLSCLSYVCMDVCMNIRCPAGRQATKRLLAGFNRAETGTGGWRWGGGLAIF